MIKRFLIIFVPLMLIVSPLILSLYYFDIKAEKEILLNHQKNDVLFGSKAVVSDIAIIISDLLFHAKQHELIQLVENDINFDLSDLERNLLIYTAQKGAYDQVRLINADGMETFRINYNDGNPAIVNNDKLLSVRNRYYFQESITLDKGDVYISPIDLNIENSVIQQPLKPMIRFATPIFNSFGKKHGIIVLNYFANAMIRNLIASCSLDNDVFLLNSNGYCLHSSEPKDTFGFMFNDKKGLTFGNRYQEAWRLIESKDSGQFINSDGLFTFYKIFPFLEVYKDRVFQSYFKDYNWIVVSYVSTGNLSSIFNHTLFKYLLIWLFSSALLSVCTWYFSQVRTIREGAIEAISENEMKLDGIIKSIADGLIVTDNNNIITLMNPAAEAIFKVSMNSVINKPIDEAIHEDKLRGKVSDTLNKKKNGYQFDFNINNGNNHQRTMRARTSQIHDRNENENGIVTIISDVSYEREIERAKTEFLSTAAHELRSPLTSIRGFSEIMLIRKNLSEADKEKYMTYINEQSKVLTTIINDLLDISKIESGKGFVFNKSEFNICKCIGEVVSCFRSQTQKHHFKLSLPDNGFKMSADREKIIQLINNLVSNAVKYSPRGGKIEVKGEFADKDFKLSIQDEGIGMTPEQLSRLFEKFYRANTSNSAIEGTGLGMTIAKHIVEGHGGKIWLESEYGRGTTVNVTIPVYCN